MKVSVGMCLEAVCACTDTSTCVHTHTDTHPGHSIYQPAAQGLLSIHTHMKCQGKPFPPIACMLLPGQSRKVALSFHMWKDLQPHGQCPRPAQQPPAALKADAPQGR